ncbi:hypothetical protein FNT36_16520 [Hymenobacter setariae]|uniref:Uncharacterized protein n=1 Tax=Hymenobacter setariae TaxID=2594794 RepID=A0A558BRY0_9BACT|nr:hypothetical protein FNT36_16520 [Hymenobacter setariae]
MAFLEFTLPSGVATIINTDQIVSIAKDQDAQRKKDSSLEYIITMSDNSIVLLTKDDYEGLRNFLEVTDLSAIANNENMKRILNRN